MLDFSLIIPNWDIMNAKEKFISVSKYQKSDKTKIIRVRIKKPRIRKPKPHKEKFKPIDGYYQGKVLAELVNVNFSTIKRYVKKGNIREYKVGRNVAYCLYDILLEQERAKNTRIQCGIITGHKNRIN
jgi:hypothetical protein